MLDKPDIETGEDLKRAAILAGAMQLFLTHGFKRVTMEDIATAAGMSRPALYLVYRNKTDIYRALAEQVFEQCSRACKEALSGPGRLSDRLISAINSVVFGLMQEIEKTPHGTELMDLKSSLAGDLIERWMAIVAGQYAEAIEADAKARGVDLAARGLTSIGLATTLICGVDGAKQCFVSTEARRDAVNNVIRVIDLAIA